MQFKFGKTTTEIYAQRDRLFRAHMRRGKRLAERAHPETGGNECLVGNWGNDAAKRAWAEAWARWQCISAASDRAYSLAEHARHGAEFRPLWCEHCKPAIHKAEIERRQQSKLTRQYRAQMGVA